MALRARSPKELCDLIECYQIDLSSFSGCLWSALHVTDPRTGLCMPK